MTEYKRINENVWRNFGKNLLSDSNKGADKQIEFLQECRNGKDEFLQYLNNNFLDEEGALIGDADVLFKHKFTEAEFLFPPMDAQKIIYDSFKNVPKQNMGSCGFWGNVIINMIKNDLIKPDYLASNLNGVSETGIYMLDNAIRSDDSKKVDGCVRRVLRSMGNPSPRGKRIIFNDFYLGKAYWRWNWANETSNKINLSFDEILKTLDEKGYETFSEKMHSGKSYISQTNTLGGLLLFLNKNPKTLVKNMKKIIDILGYLSIWKAIEIQSPEANQQEIEAINNNLK